MYRKIFFILLLTAIAGNFIGCSMPLRTLNAHSSVNSVAYSPDGRRVLSGCNDNTIKEWELSTGKIILTLQGHNGGVYSVAYSPDGRRALSGGGDGLSWASDKTIKEWDLNTGNLIRTLKGHKGHITSVAYSPDGRRALSGSGDTTIKEWDLSTGNLLRTLEGHVYNVLAVAYSPDGRRALSGSSDNTIKEWDLSSGKLLRTLEGHNGNVGSVAYSPDGRRALSGSDDKTIKEWDLSSGKLLRTLEGHNEDVSSVAYSPDGRRALSGSWDKTTKEWDLSTGEALRTLDGIVNAGTVQSVAYSPDGSHALSGNMMNFINEWDLGHSPVKAIKPPVMTETIAANTPQPPAISTLPIIESVKPSVVVEVATAPFIPEEKPQFQTSAMTHTVQRGETLYSIARMYGTTYQALAALNALSPPYSMYVGQVLRLPSSTASDQQTPGNKTPPVPVVENTQPTQVVKPQPVAQPVKPVEKPEIPRFALLIGNAAYPARQENLNHATPLKNPRADAQDMADVLNGYGFKTTVLTDADRAAMENGVQAFVRQLTPGSIALFYYSGHGVQINDKGQGESRNYLLPVKQNFATAAQIKHNAVNANWVLEELQGSPAQVKLMILDACREKMVLETDGKNLGGTGGFGAMGASGVLIAYASARGQLAYGDSNARNSVYTGYLLQAMRNGGGWLIEKVFREANTAVVTLSKQQEPWTEGNLIGGDFCLAGCGE